MSRLIFLLAIAALVYLLLKSLRKPPPAATLTENMVRCAHCGVHLPEGESLREQDRYYCCDAHLAASRSSR